MTPQKEHYMTIKQEQRARKEAQGADRC